MALFRILQWIASLSLLSFIILSVFVSRRISGHRLRVKSAKFRLVPLSLSLYGLSYSYIDAISISSSHLQVSLKLPSIPNTTFFTATIYDYDYTDAQHHVSAKLHVKIQLFPVAPETFINVVLDDFKARISKSQDTPPWLQTMRQNLIRTVLNGEHLRLDDFNTQIILCTGGIRRKAMTPPDKHAGQSNKLVDGEKCQLNSSKLSLATGEMSTDSNESVVTLNASEWHMKGAQQRLYHLGSIDAQLRRSWKCDKATFALVAQDSSWILTPHSPVVSTTKDPAQYETSRLVHFLHKPLFILKAFLSFPFTLIKTIHDPASALTLHSSRLDVTFDQFRLRDAELVRQLWEFMQRKYELFKEKKGTDVKGFAQDMLMAGIFGNTRREI